MIKPGDIIIKNAEVLRGLMDRRFSPLLVDIILAVAQKYGLVITESWRPRRHSGDLHGTQPVRAVDIREWCYPDGLAYRIAKWINQTWCYDPRRPNKPVALIHKTKGGVLHFHIQVHPNTIRRGYI